MFLIGKSFISLSEAKDDLNGGHFNSDFTKVEDYSSAVNYMPAAVQPGDSVIYTNGSCLAAMPDFTVLYGIVVNQSIAPGTMLRKGRYFVRITNFLGFPAGVRIVSVVDNISPVFTTINSQTVNVANGSCAQIVNYSGTVSDNCAYIPPTSINGFTSIGDHNGHRYFRSTGTYNWYDANNLAFSLGGYLVTINDNAERTFLEGTGQCWIGLNEMNNVGGNDFTWINGEVSSYSHWMSGRPILNSDPSGVVINNSPGNRWGDWPATDNYRFILEFPLTAEEQITVTRTSGLASGASFPAGTTTVTFAATDESGNSATTSFNVNVNDNINPTITCNSTSSGNTQSNSCSGPVNIPNPTINDNCGVVTLLWQMTGATVASSPTAGINHIGSYNFNRGTTTIIYRAIDAAGNVATCSSTVNITDNVPPVISGCPNNMSVVASATCQATIPNYLTWVTATDNCGGSVTLSQNPAAGNTISSNTTVTITAVDAQNNASTCSFIISLIDNTPPIVYSVPVDPVLYVGNSCSAVLPNYASQGSYGDNCSTAALSVTQTPAAGTVINADTQVTITITDASNNSTTRIVNANLEDTLAPIIQCNNSINANASATACSAGVSIPVPTYSDNCGVTALTWQMTGATVGSSPATGINQIGTHSFNTGVTTVRYTVSDGSLNTATCFFTVTVVDTTNPTISCPTEVSGQTNDAVCNTQLTVTNPVINDNCGVVSLRWVMTGATTASSPTAGISYIGSYTFNVGTTHVTYIATDAAGNSATCSFDVSTLDAVAPSITCPDNLSGIPAGAGLCTATLTLQTPVATDNCGIQVITNSIVANTQTPTYAFPIGTTHVVWTAIDFNGLSSSCTQTVTVVDLQLPTISCSNNITANVDANSCTKSMAIPNATVNDNCAVQSLTWTMSGATSASSVATGINNLGTRVFNLGVTTVSYLVTDNAGNTRNCSFTVTISDNIAPTVSCPSNISTDVSTGACTKQLTPTTPTYSDNCTVSRLTWTMTGATSGSSPTTGINTVGLQTFNLGVTTVTYVVTDAANNASNCSFTVTVNDNIAPTVSCPSSITTDVSAGSCTKQLTPTAPTYSDNCSVSKLTWTMTGNTSGSSPTTGINTVGLQTFNIGVTTVTYVVTDAANNTSNCSFTVTVNDNIAPVVSCPSNITTDVAAGSCTKQLTPTAPTYSDNCSVSRLTWTMTGATSGSSPTTGINTVGLQTFNIGVTTVTHVITDATNNTSNCSFTVTVNDNIAPTVSCPSNITTEVSAGSCTKQLTTAAPTYADNCSVSRLTWTMTGATSGSSATTGINTIGLQTFNLGVTTITYVVTDAANNSSNCSFTVTVNDNIAPTISCSANITTNVSAGSCTKQLTPTAPTYSDNCSVSRLTWTLTGATSGSSPTTGINTIGLHTFNLGVTTVTYVVADAANKTSSCSFTVTVNDNITPTITCGGNVNVNTDSGACTKLISIPDPVYADNCTIDKLTWSLSGATIDSSPSTGINLIGTRLFNSGVTTITYKAVDNTGNYSVCNITVTVTDNISPTISCANNITAVTSVGSCAKVLTVTPPTATDNCGLVTISNNLTNSAVISNHSFTKGITTIVWKATDASGNETSCVQTVTVNDNQMPIVSYSPADINTSAENGLCGKNLTIAPPIATDNCGVLHIVNDYPLATSASNASGFYPVGTTIVEWQVSDESDNLIILHQTIQINDNEDPAITCNGTVNASVNAGSCTANVTIQTPVVSDNCAIANVVNTSPYKTSATNASGQYPIGVSEFDWIVTDVNGNDATCHVVVTVSDNTPPIILCQSATVELNRTGSCEAVLPDLRNTLSVSDNCTAGADIVITQIPAPGTIINANQQVVFTAKDAALNESSSCSLSVVLIDSTAPVILCGNDIEVITPPGEAEIWVDFGLPLATDNCTTNLTVYNNYTNSNTHEALFEIGSQIVTWYATDAAGNTSQCSITVSVISGDVPLIDCQEEQVYYTDDNHCSVPVNLQTPSASDSDGIIGEVNHNYSASTFPVGNHNVIWSAVDALGNTGYCTTNVIVLDTIVPVINCADTIIGQTVLGQNTGILTLEIPTVIEACTFSLINLWNNTSSAPTLFDLGTSEVIWKATDASGNIGYCTTVVIIEDNAAPNIECIEVLTYNTDLGDCSAWLTISPPLITDNEQNVVMTNSINGTDVLEGNFESGEHTVIWSAEDINGNITTCTQTFFVSDNEAPVINCQDTVTVYTTGNVCGAQVYIQTPLLTDNCDSNPTIVNTKTNAATFDTFIDSLGIHEYTWFAFDYSINYGYCPFIVNIIDTTGFIFDCPSNESILLYPGENHLIENYIPSLPQFDECGIEMTYTQSPSAGISIFASQIVTITATDGRGNHNVCSFEITVIPYDVPVVIECPGPNVTIYLGNDCNTYYPDLSSWLNDSNIQYGGQYTVHQNPSAGEQYGEADAIELWVEDEYGFTTEPCLIQVLVKDTIAPVITPINQNNLIVTCNPEFSYTPTIEDCNAGAVITQQSGNDPLQVGSNVITFIATDGENTSTYSYTIELVEMPEILWSDIPSSICPDAEAIEFLVNTEADYHFEVDGIVMEGNIFNPAEYSTGSHSIKLIAQYSACSSMLHQSITVLPLPSIAIVDNDYRTCTGDLTLQVSTNATAILWQSFTDDVLIENPTSASTDVVSLSYGNFVVKVTGTLEGCSLSDETLIHFYEQPTKPFAGEDQTVHLANQVILSGEYSGVGQTSWSVLSGNGTFYEENNPVTQVNGFDLGDNYYLLTVLNEICFAKDTVKVNVNGLFIPNGYSPNGDGVNDYFEIKGIQNLAEAELKIFNRWGQQVFVSEKYANEWNGFNSSKIELPDDTYFYELKLENDNYNGYVVIKR